MFQHGSTCYQTASAANQVAASAQAGSVVQIGGQTYVLAVSGVTDTSITYDYSPVSGRAHILQTVAMVPAPCGLLTAADALEIGWAIALCWLTVYAITFISNMLKAEIAGSQNDA